jgi:hypothetical protein
MLLVFYPKASVLVKEQLFQGLVIKQYEDARAGKSLPAISQSFLWEIAKDFRRRIASPEKSRTENIAITNRSLLHVGSRISR